MTNPNKQTNDEKNPTVLTIPDSDYPGDADYPPPSYGDLPKSTNYVIEDQKVSVKSVGDIEAPVGTSEDGVWRRLKIAFGTAVGTTYNGDRAPSLRFSCAENLSLSGIKHVCGKTTHLLRRFLWIVLIIVMLVLLLRTFVERGRRYQRAPTDSQVSQILSAQIPFPSIILCNTNQIRSSGAYRLLQQDEFPHRPHRLTIYEAVTAYFKVLKQWTEEGAREFEQEFSEVLKVCYNDGVCDHLYKDAGHKKEDLIYRCSWRGRECSHENFTEVYTDLGLCFRWNGGEDDEYVHQAESSGLSGGLSLDLNIEQYDYMTCLKEVAGAYVLIQDQEDQKNMVDGHGFTVSKGSYTTVGLDKVVTEDKPYSSKMKCTAGKSYDVCIHKCYEIYLKDACGCREWFMSGNTRTCNLEESLSCMYPHKEEFPSLQNYTDYCGHCQPACNRTRFDMTISASPFSNFFASREVKYLHKNSYEGMMSKHAELMRIREWSSIGEANREYTHTIFNMSLDFSHVYHEVTETYVLPMLRIAAIPGIVTGEKFDGINDTEVEDIRVTVDSVLGVYQDLALFIPESYFFNYSNDHSRIAEDINVRIATTLTRRLPITREFISHVNRAIKSIRGKLSNLETQWRAVINYCSTDPKITATPPEFGDNFSHVEIGRQQALDISDLLLSCEHLDEIMTATIRDLLVRTSALIDMLADTNRDHEALRLAIALDPMVPPSEPNPSTFHEGFYKENYARVVIYFNDMSYVLKKEVLGYDEWALISDIGGALGFYLGGSALTMMEIADILFIKLIAKIWKARN